MAQPPERISDFDSSGERGAALPGDELQKLKPWSKVALAVRAALRVEPMLWTSPPEEREKARQVIQVVYAAVSFAMLSCREGKPFREALTLHLAAALKKLLESWSGMRSGYFVLHACYQTLRASDPKLEDDPGYPVRDALDSAVSAFELKFGKEPALEFLRAMEWDIREFQSWELTDESREQPGAPTGFFHRPLWPSEAKLPEGWQSEIDSSYSVLTSLGLGDLHRFYGPIYLGGFVDWNWYAQLVDEWAVINVTPYEPAAHENREGAKPPEAPESAAAARQAIRASLHMLSDQPLEDEAGDRLEFKDYANALAGMIDNRATSTPFTLAINAPWGAGKSTLGKMVLRRLEGGVKGFQLENEHATCWFNAWMHDDAENLMAAFAGVVAREADQKRDWWWRLLRPIPSSLLDPHARLRRRLTMAALVIAILLGMAPVVVKRLSAAAPTQAPQSESGPAQAHSQPEAQPSQPPPAKSAQTGSAPETQSASEKPESKKDEDKEPEDLLLTRLKEISPYLAGLLAFLGLMGKISSAFDPFAKAVAGFVQNPASASSNLSMAAVSEQLGKLIEQATPEGGRFVIFVDDLDRCKPPRAVDVLEVVNQLLNHEDVVVVLMADMPGVAACADIKYKDIAEHYIPGEGWVEGSPNGSTRAFGRFYLQKIIQLQFDIPVHTQEQMQKLVKKLASELPEPEVAARPKLPGSQAKSFRQRVKENWQKEETVLGLLRSMWQTEEAIPVRLAAALMWLSFLPALVTFGTAARFSFGRKKVTLIDKWAEIAMGVLLAFFLLAYFFLVVWWGSSTTTSADTVSILGIPWLPRLPRISFLRMAGYLLTLSVLCGLFASLVYRRQKNLELRRSQKARTAIDGQIESLVKAGERDLSRIKSAIHVDVNLGGREEQYIDERIRLRMMNDAALLEEAYQEVIAHLPALPRNAKRMLNRLRLLLYIAHEKKMFGGAPPLTPRHIGKWVVLRERWPELAFHFLSAPEELADLETLAAFPFPEMFYERVKTLAADHADDPDLVLFLRKETRLGEVLPRIVHFESAGANLAN